MAHCCQAQAIPSNRSTNWTLAGYHGAIPTYPLIKNITDFGGSGNGAALNDSALQIAIASLAGQNGVIYFPAGTFLFHSPVTLRSGLILRGAGAPGTTLLFNLSGGGNLITIGGNTPGSISRITAAIGKEGTSLKAENPSLFQVNDYIRIYQKDAGLVEEGSGYNFLGQVVHIENISGDSIYFSNPLRKDYSLADTPKILRLVMTTGVGIECLKIKRIDQAGPVISNVFFSNAAKCWMKSVESDSCNFAHVRIANSTNIEITGSYFHGAFSYGAGGEGYGISCEYTSGECLIENNIFKHLRHSMLIQSGANGNVFDYNYSTGPFKSESFPNDLSGDIVLHGNYAYLNLFEGNIVQNMVVDASHGINGPYNALFRNRAESYGIIISAGAGDSTSLIGNEINGTGIGKGNYLMQGAGNLEYANNRNNTIIPVGTTTAPPNSYIYSAIPAFWNISSPWPPIGVPHSLGTGSIPAKDRYLANTPLTPCITSAPLVYTFTGNGNWNEPGNWENNLPPPAAPSAGSEIIINPSGAGKCILNIPYTIQPGIKLTVTAEKNFLVRGNLTIHQ